MLNMIQHALMIANFLIDQPALLEIDRKIAILRWGNSHRVEKLASLCLLSVCFFG
jgi:hypothetical protein